MTPIQFAEALEGAGWSCYRETRREDGLHVLYLIEGDTRKRRMFLGKTETEAMVRAMLEILGLVPEQKSDRMDANRISRVCLTHAIWKLLPSDEDDVL